MKRLLLIGLILWTLTQNAFGQVSSLPYYYGWTGADSITGDGNWSTQTSGGSKNEWVKSDTGGFSGTECAFLPGGIHGTNNTIRLKLSFNLTGKIITGTESFSYYIKWTSAGTKDAVILTEYSTDGSSYSPFGGTFTIKSLPANAYTLISYQLPIGVLDNQANVSFALSVGPTGGGNGLDNLLVDDAAVENTVLPIQIASFNANVATSNVNLEWSTISETNNLGFYIERSSNGASYETVSSLIAGAGTTLEMNTYSFTDANAPAGKLTYRLRQVDLDGTVSYSHEIIIIVSSVLAVRNDGGTPTQFKLQQNYPNPFNPSTEIKFSIKDAGFTSLKIYNEAGQEVATLVNETMQANNYSVTWNASNMPSGVYFSRIISGSNTEVQRMLMIK